MSQHGHPALRLTPAHSPFFRNTSPRSPTKAYRSEEPGLQLKKVIGTTTSSANGFDSLPATRSFAFTAGAAAVLATVGEGLHVTQRFFRARPTHGGGLRDQWPASPTPGEPRHRVLGSLREHSVSGSPLASSGRDWSDSPTGRSTTAKDRVKAVTSVALSPNGKWLAIGETGYKPRIGIFALGDDSCDAPLTTISEHSFGVHALRFSPDSRYLASLGTVNDGFLYIWTIDDKTGSATLHASNKLTILTNAMTWVGKTLVTAGLRFVKVWRPEDESTDSQRSDLAASTLLTPRTRADLRSSDFGNSILSPKHRTLAGKNSVLGDLLECNFVSIVPVSDTQSIICAETGEICLLDDKQKTLVLNLIKIVTFAIGAARIDGAGLLDVLGPDSLSETLNASEYLHPSRPPSRTRAQPVSPTKAWPKSKSIIASACLGDDAVELSSERVITLRSGPRSSIQSLVELPAHKEAVQGVRPFRSGGLPSTRFLTFSASGTVHLWDEDGRLVKSMITPVPNLASHQSASNEMKCVAGNRAGHWLASGDKCGILTISDLTTDNTIAQVRAHSAEIMDLAVFSIGGFDYVATAGRDRMVQLFVWAEGQLSLLQTLDEHAGAATGILFESAGQRLLSHSADRSVVVREALLRNPNDASSLVFAMLRTITLKATPTSMCLAGDDELLISTVDRCIGRYRLKHGQCNLNFKCSDLDGGEAVVMSKVLYAPSLNGNPTIAGVTSTDKSVRLYTDYGSLIARDWGHTEGITDIALLSNDIVDNETAPESPKLVTVAADSTIFIWDTTPSATFANNDVPAPDGLSGLLGVGDDVAMAPPLRKVISHTELSRFRRRTSADESEPTSPTATLTASPQRLRKKTSRVSIAQPPRLEPAFRSGTVKSSRRESLRHRSPSPPSPKANTVSKRDQSIHMRRRSMATLRSKSTDNVLKEMTSPPKEATASGLTASTELLCRTLQSYRKRLATNMNTASETLTTDATRELEKELRLTSLMIAERQQGKTLDETVVMAKLLDSASDKLVGLLDEKIKERVETEVRKSSGSSLSTFDGHANGQKRELDAVSGALEAVALDTTGYSA